MIYDTVIKNSKVVAANGVVNSDIGITNGRIAAIEPKLDGENIIDAAGLIALPGGIDSHVHISQPSGPGIEIADDFETGTRSAACRGNTTILPFCPTKQIKQSELHHGSDYTPWESFVVTGWPVQTILRSNGHERGSANW